MAGEASIFAHTCNYYPRTQKMQHGAFWAALCLAIDELFKNFDASSL